MTGSTVAVVTLLASTLRLPHQLIVRLWPQRLSPSDWPQVACRRESTARSQAATWFQFMKMRLTEASTAFTQNLAVLRPYRPVIIGADHCQWPIRTLSES
jgi:hypothetical protein